MTDLPARPPTPFATLDDMPGEVRELVFAAVARHDGGAARYEQADVVALPFPDGAFDAVRAERWFAAFDDALARNEFLAVLTMWVVAGSVA